MGIRSKRPIAAFVCACLVVVASLSYYGIENTYWRTAHEWQAGQYDPADYRIVAEHFWGVAPEPDTYHFGRSYEREWAQYLDVVPFRGIALGSAFLAVSWAVNGHPPRTDTEVVAAGHAVAIIEKVLLVAAMLLLFAMTHEVWGPVAALLALAAVAFPPRLWRLTDELMSEPALRIVFLLVLSAAIAFGSARWRRTAAVSLPVLLLAAAHLKVQWWVGAVLLSPVVIAELIGDSMALTGALVGALTLAIPLSVVAVNWIGWRSTSLSPGLGIHVHIAYGDEMLEEFCAQYRSPGNPPAFCDPAQRRIAWWNLSMGPENSVRDYEALDTYARRYVIAHPANALEQFVEGVGRASSFPGVAVIRDGRLRVEPLPDAWRPFADTVDLFVWGLLVAGLLSARTRLMAWTALVLWIIPAIGDVFSWYEPRYHQPMAGIGLAVAILVALDVWPDSAVGPRLSWRRSPPP